jgi:hypothetical protein
VVKVYPVLRWQMDGVEEETDIIAIFSSRELAEEYIASLHYHPANKEFYLQEFKVLDTFHNGGYLEPDSQ